MTTLRTMSRRTVILACVAQSLVCVAPPLAFTESPTIDIVSDYRYAYHEPETVAEAKQVACFRSPSSGHQHHGGGARTDGVNR